MNTTGTSPTPSQAILVFTIVGFAIVSVLGIIGSAITVIVIAASKSLHSPCFTLLAGGGIGSFTVATHFLARAIDKTGLKVGAFGFERTSLRCLLTVGVLGIWGIAFHSQICSVVAIDRLISVTAPIKYRRLGKRYAAAMLATCAVLVTLQEVVGFATAPLYTTVVCNEFGPALHPLFIKSYAPINLFYCVVNVLAYAGMMISFRFRHLFSSNGASRQDSFMKQQQAVMPTVKLMVLLYLITGVTAEVVINIALQVLPSQAGFMLLAIGHILKDASSLVEGFSLFVRNKRFRDCFRVLIGRKPNAVASCSMRSNTRNR